MKLKELRLNKNLTQTQLAKEFKVTQKTIANYETGTTQPTFDILIKIANYFNVSLDYLLENQASNLIDMSEFSDEKKELLNLIVTQDNKTCNRLHAVVFGYLTSYHETKQSFNPFRNFKE